MSMTRADRVGFVAVLMLVPALAGIGPAGLAAESDNWPHFRGPTMNAAVADNPDLPETWSQTENVEWVTDVPGLGWSSPVVWGNRVFLTTVTAGLRDNPDPSHEEAREMVAGNLCRCTGYQNIVRAVQTAAKNMKPGAAQPSGQAAPVAGGN